MRNAWVALLAWACLIGTSEVGAQTRLTARLIDEYVNPTLPISADDRTSGATVSSTRATVGDPMQPLIWFRTPYAGSLSVVIKGADGRYKSIHEVTANVEQPGWHRVKLETRSRENLSKIKSYKTHQLAFEVRRSSDRGWMLIAWQEPPESAIVTLYITAPSGGSPYLIDPLSGRPRDCKAVTGIEATEFDHACDLELKALKSLLQGGSTVRVFRPGIGGGQGDDAVFSF